MERNRIPANHKVEPINAMYTSTSYVTRGAVMERASVAIHGLNRPHRQWLDGKDSGREGGKHRLPFPSDDLTS